MKKPNEFRGAFTIVELLVSTVILTLIMVILVQLTGQTSATWRYTTGKAEQFREARNGFETMVRRISQASLNAYWDYDNPTIPTAYRRYAELRFIAGPMQAGTKRLDSQSTPPRPTHGIFFHAPFGFAAPATTGDTTWTDYRGLSTAINTWGYYLEVADDRNLRPAFLTDELVAPRVRSRLMEAMEPTLAMNVYRYTNGTPGMTAAQVTTLKNYAGFDWFRQLLTANTGQTSQTQNSHVLAENIIALALLPKLSIEDAKDVGLSEREYETALAPDYYYHSAEIGQATGKSGVLAGALNSKHQLPPVVQVTMVAIDETSARKLEITDPAEDPYGVRAGNFLTKASDFRKDLISDPEGPSSGQSLEQRLIDLKVNYRIFTTNVVIRGAKWSREQTQ